jgi:hypothetical protein
VLRHALDHIAHRTDQIHLIVGVHQEEPEGLKNVELVVGDEDLGSASA